MTLGCIIRPGEEWGGYAPYSHPYLSGAWQLFCAASPVAVSLQGQYRSVLWWLFRLRSHWKQLFALRIHLEADICGVCPPYFWLTCVHGWVWLLPWRRHFYKPHNDVSISVKISYGADHDVYTVCTKIFVEINFCCSFCDSGSHPQII